MKATKLTVMGLAIVAALALIWWCRPGDRVVAVADPARTTSLAPSGLPSPSKKPPKNAAVSILKQIMEGGPPPPLSAEQLTAYVEAQKHSAASLLAAWSICHDNAWLDEAAQRYPDDPRVALAKLGTMSDLAGDAKEWIDRLKKNDPKNGLACCYDAMSMLKEGAPEEARFALAEAARLGRFDAYTGKSSAGIAGAYESAGYDELSASMMGMSLTPLPQAQLVMNLQKELLKQFSVGPDDALVQDMLHLSKNVAGQSDPGALIMNLVGSSMERKVLNELNALDLVPGTKKMVVERMEELDQEKNLVRDLIQKVPPLMATMSDTQLKQYLRRSKVEGELKAMQWLVKQQPETR
ncbi:MAG: hypothetical protein RL693_1336 [Verrucomicrobiota bacterium]|jgi:hypothetical protein